MPEFKPGTWKGCYLSVLQSLSRCPQRCVYFRSAAGVIATVEEAPSLYPTRNVTVVRHSLNAFHRYHRLFLYSLLTLFPEGAAVALLNAIYLPLHLPSDVIVRYIGYASPRVRTRRSYLNLPPTYAQLSCKHPCRSATKLSRIMSTRTLPRSPTSITRKTLYLPSLEDSLVSTTPTARSTSLPTILGHPALVR